jgi:hypothetical protein
MLRFVALAAFPKLRRSLRAGGMFVGVVSLWHATLAILSDVGADCVEDLVDGQVGKIGRWVLLATFLTVWAIRARRGGTGERLEPKSSRPRRGRRWVRRRVATSDRGVSVVPWDRRSRSRANWARPVRTM